MTWLLYAFTPEPVQLASFAAEWRCTDQLEVVLKLWAALSDATIYATCVLAS